jgi:hypothetical protein
VLVHGLNGLYQYILVHPLSVARKCHWPLL